MRRIFGAKKPTVQGPSLEEAQEKVEAKVKKLDRELFEIREQMKKTRPGPAQNALKQKALRILKQKKMYEAQSVSMQNQAFNMETQNFAQQTLKDTITTVGAMKQGAEEMKRQFKAIDINEVENLHDDIQDLLEDNEEIQEVLSRNYALEGMDIDETELEAELDALGEMDFEAEADGLPSYLQESVPSNPVPATQQVDDFGLPAIPQTI